MKNRKIKNLKLNKNLVSNLKNGKIQGGLNYTNPLATACSAGCSIGCSLAVTCPGLTC